MSFLGYFDIICILTIALIQKMIPNDVSNLKCIDNFIFAFATWICALGGKKKNGRWRGMTKRRHCYYNSYYSYRDKSGFFLNS